MKDVKLNCKNAARLDLKFVFKTVMGHFDLIFFTMMTPY